jgi:hypothetical protein
MYIFRKLFARGLYLSPDADPSAEPQTREEAPTSGRNQSALDRRNAIADAADARRASELMDTDGDNVVGEFGGTPEEREAAAQSESEAAERALQTASEEAAAALQAEGVDQATKPVKTAAAVPEEDSKVVDGVTYYKLVVNGKTKWLSMAQMRATAGKVDSADEYLKTAKESVTNAARTFAPSATDEQVSVEEDDIEKTLGSALLGDEGAIKKLAQRLKAKPSEVTPDVLHAVDEHLSRKSFATSFKEKHKAIFDDPEARELFHDLDTASAKRAVDEGIEIALADRLEQVAERVKKIRGVTPKDEKLARKQAASNVPAAAGRQAGRSDEDAEEPVENVIAQMAKSRGSRAIRH